MLTLVSELEVLIPTLHWLHENGWAIESISPATGSGLLPIEEQKQRVKGELEAAHVPYDERNVFRHRGPDIVTRSGQGIWKIECKGLGNGTKRTHKNNFDRAVASVMSYCDAPQVRLGLALANDYLWAYYFRDKLPKALRKATNLWVFLIVAGKAYPYEPSEELPYPGVFD